MLTNFFNEFPKKYNKKSIWNIKIIRLYFNRDDVILSRTIKGSLWRVYLITRFLALFEDFNTSGRYFGVAWHIEDCKNNVVYGYKMEKEEKRNESLCM